ncbi:MAG: hypothetical protein DPW09_13270 [Anaerolineae bacterium]|nr:hypothetical protein [Anaerolineae bacterium]
MSEKNIILAGLGPHARRIYYPLLEKYARQYQIKVPLIIDLHAQKETICAYLSNRMLQPERLFFVENQERNSETLPESLHQVLVEVGSKEKIHGLIISTEPKAHKPYIFWAIDQNIDILIDKPISAPIGAGTNLEAAQKIWQDYQKISRRLEQSRSNLVVQCQRRSHPGYRLIKNYLQDFVCAYAIPISYIDIYHADGMWSMPGELFQRENHPYKYGYGKLMHSGYHFIDLFGWLAEINCLIEAKQPTSVDLYVKRFRPFDFMQQINQVDYQRLLGVEQPAHFFEAARPDLGELDVFILGQLKRGEAVITTTSINLQQNSFCRRAWPYEPKDVYKGNGRVRHERLNIQVSNLLNIQVHSYQSYEVGKKDVITTGAGHEDHFDIFIFRNSGLVGGQPLAKFSLGEEVRREHSQDSSYLGHNEQAREALFLDFLEGRPSPSHFSTHGLTNKLLSKIYECIVKENCGSLPHLEFEL